MKRKSKNKLWGWIGFIRVLIYMTGVFGALITFFLVTAFLSVLIWDHVSYRFFYISIFLYCVFGTVYMIRSGRYFVRPLSQKEYEDLKGRRLIHYTDYFSDEDEENYHKTGEITLRGNCSRKGSYSLKWKIAHLPYVWFHLEDDRRPMEPTLKSFWDSHGGESIPRRYKAVFELNSFEKEDLLIRPSDQVIIVCGNVKGSGKLFTSFPWYNNRIYFWRSFYHNPLELALMPYVLIRQMIGVVFDSFDDPKRHFFNLLQVLVIFSYFLITVYLAVR